MTQVQLLISSEIRLIDLVHTASENVAEMAGFDADDALNVGLAVREAVINAIIHGNGQDPEKQVRVSLSANGNGMEARILDQGEGFDPERNANPTEGAALMATSGRGILMMHAFVDDVVQARVDAGFEVILTKKLTR